MKTINIQGNNYVMVNERVKEFHKLYPNGMIYTKVVEMTDTRVVTSTRVVPDCEDTDRFFTGLAYEIIGKGNVNSTSSLENCETSSVGRALGFLNIGIDHSIASAEEVKNAVTNQMERNASDKQKNLIKRLLASKEIDSGFCDFDKMSMKLASTLIDELNLKGKQFNKEVIENLLITIIPESIKEGVPSENNTND